MTPEERKEFLENTDGCLMPTLNKLRKEINKPIVDYKVFIENRCKYYKFILLDFEVMKPTQKDEYFQLKGFLTVFNLISVTILFSI